jgi:hypothetical protein
MTRKQNRYASKARNEARINGQTIRGRQSTSPALLRLTGLNESSTPAEQVRHALKRVKDIAAGKLRVRASNEELKQGRGVTPAVVRATGLL